MDTATQDQRPSAMTAAARVDAADSANAAAVAQRAYENRLRAIATNAVLASMACNGRVTLTDDDAARVDAIQRILRLPPVADVNGFVPVVPASQTATPIDSAALQSAVQGALLEKGE